jgi:hypothetical protein
MEQPGQDHEYEPPVVEDVQADDGPATLQAGPLQQTPVA